MGKQVAGHSGLLLSIRHASPSPLPLTYSCHVGRESLGDREYGKYSPNRKKEKGQENGIN